MISRLLKSQAFILPILLTLIFIIDANEFIAVISGFFLSLVFVISSTIIVEKFWNSDEPTFFKAFILSIPLRFFFVLTTFAVLLLVTKIDEIYFTVSFIISYLYHSITETIFINKILQKGSSSS